MPTQKYDKNQGQGKNLSGRDQSERQASGSKMPSRSNEECSDNGRGSSASSRGSSASSSGSSASSHGSSGSNRGSSGSNQQLSGSQGKASKTSMPSSSEDEEE